MKPHKLKAALNEARQKAASAERGLKAALSKAVATKAQSRKAKVIFKSARKKAKAAKVAFQSADQLAEEAARRLKKLLAKAAKSHSKASTPPPVRRKKMPSVSPIHRLRKRLPRPLPAKVQNRPKQVARLRPPKAAPRKSKPKKLVIASTASEKSRQAVTLARSGVSGHKPVHARPARANRRARPDDGPAHSPAKAPAGSNKATLSARPVNATTLKPSAPAPKPVIHVPREFETSSSQVEPEPSGLPPQPPKPPEELPTVSTGQGSGKTGEQPGEG